MNNAVYSNGLDLIRLNGYEQVFRTASCLQISHKDLFENRRGLKQAAGKTLSIFFLTLTTGPTCSRAFNKSSKKYEYLVTVKSCSHKVSVNKSISDSPKNQPHRQEAEMPC
jgi:hypothetical protein